MKKKKKIKKRSTHFRVEITAKDQWDFYILARVNKKPIKNLMGDLIRAWVNAQKKKHPLFKDQPTAEELLK